MVMGSMCKKGPTKQKRINAFNDAGWTVFEEGDFSDALLEFNDAYRLDTSDVTANVGRGWCLLLLGDPNLASIVNVLQKGTTSTTWQNDAWCGLAVARLNQQLYPEADSLAGLVLASDSSYVFTYWSQIDWRDLLLIQAQARYIMTSYTLAWNAIAPLLAGSPYESIDPASTATWIVNNRLYPLFEEILVVVISALTEEYR
jgi:hypothetical protein